RLCERLADRVEQTRVRRRVAAARAADRPLVDDDHALTSGDRAIDQRALAGPRDAGQDAQHADRDVDVDVAQVVRAGATYLEHARWRLARFLPLCLVVQVTPRHRAAGPQRVDRALEADLTARGAGARPEVHDVVRDR